MAGKTDNQDPSMTEIIASIRDIIDSDSPGADPVRGGSPGVEARPGAEPDDDILDLEERIDDGPLDPGDAVEHAVEDAVEHAVDDTEEVAAETGAAAREPVPDVPEAGAPEHDPAPPPAAARENAPARPVADEPAASDDDGNGGCGELMSDRSRDAAVTALGSVAKASERAPLDGVPRGRAVEELVMEQLTPMLSRWLDEHLPAIVERIVEREVRYLSRRTDDDRT